MRSLSAWRLPLRLARRDAVRHRARSALVLLMIALPVLAVTAADVLISTSSVSGPESLDRRLGSAQALVTVTDGIQDVQQRPDPEDGFPNLQGDGESPAPDADQVASLLDGARLLDLRQGQVQIATDDGRTDAQAVETDLSDPVTDGLFRLTSGRLPRAAGEVVVNQALLDEGYDVGDRLDLTADGAPAAPTIVGVAESATVRGFPVAAGPLDTLGVQTEGATTWLVDGGAVSWATVRQLNAIGALVASRSVIEHPPPSSQWPPGLQPGSSDDSSLAVIGLVVVMALIEVVLLAGPAFAVSARKQQRSLALLAATGGTPPQARRVVVAGAVVLGGVGAAIGVVLGIGVARLAQPLFQARSVEWFGPFQVSWLHLLGVAAFGLLSAVLAAAVPAYLASRQDVVAVLAGRRGDRPPSLRSPLLGLVLLGAGIAGSVAGATRSSGGELLIAASAIPAVLGMVLLVPVVLAGLARLSGRLPLALRYAVRDADRHRTRTVPAVSAVAATVAGVVALGIGMSSDAAENQATYQPSLPRGVAMVSGADPDTSWDSLRAIVQRTLPGATITAQRGLTDEDSYTEVLDGDEPLVSSSGGAVGANIMVSDDDLPLGLLGVSAADARRARAALAAGEVVAFANSRRPDGPVALVTHRFDPTTGEDQGVRRAQADATFVTVDGTWPGPAAVVPTAVADQLQTEPRTVSLAVTGVSVSEDQEKAVDEGLTAVAQYASMYVERGYQADDATVIIQIVLVLLGGVLMLGGTLTATFLALSDARPDLATLAAIGASPRTRRAVAAAYAVVVGVVGAVLGAAVGFIPGVAVSRPLTTANYNDGPSGPYLDVPWLMVFGLVVLLPAVTALVVGIAARSRLPLVARLD
ncbi:ABC transporter permease [Nocardioides anomalus]|uniref:ABC transporter permease n=1 Tax=Nocardioides anomalus TaxID=2712223 RepID=A0A6G6WIN6_9ACTN|nr:ABC transporter permease [Nocardioides anomalus]QIG45066.1 ABC transporter permease [Nocardioides anomalus]